MSTEEKVTGNLQEKPWFAEVEHYEYNALNCVSGGIINVERKLNTIMVSNYTTQYDLNKMHGHDCDNVALVEKLKKHAKKSGWNGLVKLIEKDNGEENIDLDKITFFEKR